MIKEDRHIILYSKYHYEKNDIISDLKILYSIRNGINIEYLNERQIASNLLNLVTSFIINNGNSFHDFINAINPYNPLFKIYNENYKFYTAIIKKCLSILSLLEIKDIPFDLGNKDNTIQERILKGK